MVYKTLALFIFTSFGPIQARETERKILIDDEEENRAPAHANCHIEIERTNSLDYLILQKIHTVAENKEDCKRKSLPHQINLAPDEIKKVDVKTVFDEK